MSEWIDTHIRMKRALNHIEAVVTLILNQARAATDDQQRVVLHRLSPAVCKLAMLARTANEDQTVSLERLTLQLKRVEKALRIADGAMNLSASPIQSFRRRFLKAEEVNDGILHKAELEHAMTLLQSTNDASAAKMLVALLRVRPEDLPIDTSPMAPPVKSMLLSASQSPEVKLHVSPGGRERFHFEFDGKVITGRLNERGLLSAQDVGFGVGPKLMLVMDAVKRRIVVTCMGGDLLRPTGFTFNYK